MSIEVTGLSYLTCAAAYLVAALLLGLSRARHRFKGLLLGASLATALWAGAIALAALTSTPIGILDDLTPLLEQARTLAWLAAIAYVLFVAYGKRPDQGTLAILGGATGAATVFIIAVSIWRAMESLTLPTWAVRGSFIAEIVMTVVGLLLIENLFRNSGREARWAVKYLCFGIGGILIYDFFVYAEAALFARVDETLYAARGIIDAMTAPLIILAAARSRKWPIDLHVSRRVVFHSATLLAAGIYLIVMSAAGYYLRVFDTTWGGLAQTVFISAAVLGLVAMLASGSVQARLRDFINRNFFTYRYDYRQEWLRFISVVSDSLNEMSIPERIVRGLANFVESTGGAVWVLHEEDDAYHRVACWNMGNDVLPSIAATDPFIRHLAVVSQVVDLSGKTPKKEFLPAPEIPSWLTSHARAWLVLPLPHTSGLPAFAVLARPRAPRVLDWEDLELLATAGRQAASYIAEENAARSLARVRRFEDFNRQFAFVVHDIKNLTGQMTLILKNAEKHGNNPAFQRDVLATVQDSVTRMHQLLGQLRATRPGATDNSAVVDLKALIEKLATDWRLQVPGLRAEIAPGPVAVAADTAKLTQVFNHLIQNGVDAAGPDGQVSITLRRSEDGASGHWAEIVIADDGPGMDPAFVAEKLFQPLDSTKATGFGIGAYQCRQQVREMNGRLLVDSVVGTGTRMIVRLPLVAERLTATTAEAQVVQGLYRHG